MGENWCGTDDESRRRLQSGDSGRHEDRWGHGWLRAAALAQIHGTPMSSHLFPPSSACTCWRSPQDSPHYLERMDLAAPILQEPLAFKNGAGPPRERAGRRHGMGRKRGPTVRSLNNGAALQPWPCADHTVHLGGRPPTRCSPRSVPSRSTHASNTWNKNRMGRAEAGPAAAAEHSPCQPRHTWRTAWVKPMLKSHGIGMHHLELRWRAKRALHRLWRFQQISNKFGRLVGTARPPCIGKPYWVQR